MDQAELSKDSARIQLWVYKCNASNQPYQTAWGDWQEFFAAGLPDEWGGTWATRSAISIRLIWNEVAVGDLVLAYQSNLRAVIGLCEVVALSDYKDSEHRNQRDLYLEPVERFPEPVRIHELKAVLPGLAEVRALQPALIQTLYATTSEEAGILLAACGAKASLTEYAYRAAQRARSSAGGGFGDHLTNKEVESAAICLVKREYTQQGWDVQSVEREKIGYDLHVTKGGREEHLEVKGTRAADPFFIITVGELHRAETDPLMRLCIVTEALSSPKLLTWHAGEIGRQFILQPISYRARPKVGSGFLASPRGRRIVRAL